MHFAIQPIILYHSVISYILLSSKQLLSARLSLYCLPLHQASVTSIQPIFPLFLQAFFATRLLFSLHLHPTFTPAYILLHPTITLLFSFISLRLLGRSTGSKPISCKCFQFLSGLGISFSTPFGKLFHSSLESGFIFFHFFSILLRIFISYW
jgi:hypothetical protein